MRIKSKFLVLLLTVTVLTIVTAWIAPSVYKGEPASTSSAALPTGKYLYVAVPGIRNYLGFGGHGLLVYDVNNNHKFVKRIATQGLAANGSASNVKGINVSVQLNSLFISTNISLQRIDLTTEKILWEKKFEAGCDRGAISPDGQTMYLPSAEKTLYYVVNLVNGDIITTIDGMKRTHNTVFGMSGNRVYMEGIGENKFYIADAKTHKFVGNVGPFFGNIRPFTVNGSETRIFTTTDSILGFEVGDITTGKKIASIPILGWAMGPVKRHGNPSHGIGLTPDEKEVWVCDGANYNMHIFNAKPPYQQLSTIRCQDMTGWITFSLDGKYAYPSSGEVIDVKTRKILTHLVDENNNWVQSEKMVQTNITNGKVSATADQFGIGRVK